MGNEGLSSAGEQVIKTACALCVHSCGMNVYVRDGKIVRVERKNLLEKAEIGVGITFEHE